MNNEVLPVLRNLGSLKVDSHYLMRCGCAHLTSLFTHHFPPFRQSTLHPAFPSFALHIWQLPWILSCLFRLFVLVPSPFMFSILSSSNFDRLSARTEIHSSGDRKEIGDGNGVIWLEGRKFGRRDLKVSPEILLDVDYLC